MAFQKKEVQVEEPTVVAEKPKLISEFPRVKCIIESRDENEVDLPIGINEYTAHIQFGKEIEIPEPVYDMIKGLTTVKFERGEDGFTRSKEIKRYIISKV